MAHHRQHGRGRRRRIDNAGVGWYGMRECTLVFKVNHRASQTLNSGSGQLAQTWLIQAWHSPHLGHFAEDDVAAVQPRGLDGADEELGAVGVRASTVARGGTQGGKGEKMLPRRSAGGGWCTV